MVRNAPSLQVCWRPPRPDCFYLCSLLLRNSPEASVTILLFGRAVLGGAETSSSQPRSVGDCRSSIPAKRAGSSPGWGPRCSPPSRSARPSAPHFTPLTVFQRSRSPLRWHRWRRCCSSHRFPRSCRRRMLACRSPRWCGRCGYRVSARHSVAWGSRSHHVRSAAVRRSRLGPRMARLQRLRRRIHPSAHPLQPCSRQVWRRQGRAVLRADRSCRQGANVAGR